MKARAKAARIAGFCVISGALLAQFAQGIDRPPIDPMMSMCAIPFAAVLGAFIGGCCSPLVIPLLLHKRLPDAEAIVLVIATPMVAGIVWIAPDLDAIMLWSGAAFLFAAGVAFLKLPRVWETPGLCHRCGYDLRASLEFGRCPECGTEFVCMAGTAYYPAKPAPHGRLGRVLAFMRRCPVSCLAVVTVVCIALAGYDELRRSHLRRSLEAAAQRTRGTGIPIELASVATFRWDKVHVFEPYSGDADIQQDLGFRWRDADRMGVTFHDGVTLLIFVHNRSVAQYVECGRDFTEVLPDKPGGYLRQEAVLGGH